MLDLDMRMAPALYLNDTELMTHLLRNKPFTVDFLLQCSCSCESLRSTATFIGGDHIFLSGLDGFTKARMTFHWKFQEFREKIPKFLREKSSFNFFIIQAFFFLREHSITKMKILDYKIVLGECICSFLSTFLGSYFLFQSVLT